MIIVLFIVTFYGVKYATTINKKAFSIAVEKTLKPISILFKNKGNISIKQDI
jgi:hypothetical protein